VLTIASRGSELALWQARSVADGLRRSDPSLRVEISVVKTTGDRVLDLPLARIGDRGLFTKEVDEALLRGDADLAVHSFKDVPTTLPEGLALAAVTRREDPRDVLLCRPGAGGDLASLPGGARVGTSSLRRRAQLRAVRPDLRVDDLRGNLNTRLARLDAGDYDAILLAAAGVLRLGWRERITSWLEPPHWLPAVGQGALAVLAPDGRDDLRERLAALHDVPTAACCEAERAFLHALEGGCQVPIGALASTQRDRLVLHGLVAGLDGSPLLRGEHRGSLDAPADVGRALAEELLSRGAGEVLASIRDASARAPVPPP
jgi:hydroxymethylbilane synthase